MPKAANLSLRIFRARFRPQWLTATLALLVLCALLGAAQASGPIRLHPENPRYFEYNGKPAVLITAGEHYGAVINEQFDYRAYLDELANYGFNLTRIFSGSYREVPGAFDIIGNTLAPGRGRFVSPWARSTTPGAHDGENKFDLSKWNPSYLSRLKSFISEAGKRGVVVELVFFCTMYNDELWLASPMHVRNNINGVGTIGKLEVYGAKEQKLLTVQEEFVRKLVTELNAFDNLYYEICNEPYERGGLTREWNDRMVAAVASTESTLPKKHLIAQGFPRSVQPLSGVNPSVSVLNFHAAPAEIVRANKRLGKVLAFDETGGADQSDRKYRTEGWSWIIAGGAVYDHLDFSFTTDRPKGTGVPLPPGTPGGGGPELRRQLQFLKQFIEEFDFIRMQPADDLIKEKRITGGAATNYVYSLAAPGRAYAIYVNGGTQAELTADLPAGAYKAEWVNTKNGRVQKGDSFQHAGGARTLTSPAYSEDIALRIMRAAE